MSDHLLSSLRGFAIHLRTLNKDRHRIQDHWDAVEELTASLEASGHPTALSDIEGRHIARHLDALSSASPGTAARRFPLLHRYFEWAVEAGWIERSPMGDLERPPLPDRTTPVLTDDELRALLDQCDGDDFTARRDAAIIRLFIDTGARLAELADLRRSTIDVDLQQAVTGARGDQVQLRYFGIRTARAIRRYEHARERHRLATSSWLWLATDGRLTPSGVAQMLTRRSHDAGISPVHAHMFRHTFTDRWLAKGGDERDLEVLMGWRDRQAAGRDAVPAAQGRAREAYRRLAPGDQL